MVYEILNPGNSIPYVSKLVRKHNSLPEVLINAIYNNTQNITQIHTQLSFGNDIITVIVNSTYTVPLRLLNPEILSVIIRKVYQYL